MITSPRVTYYQRRIEYTLVAICTLLVIAVIVLFFEARADVQHTKLPPLRSEAVTTTVATASTESTAPARTVPLTTRPLLTTQTTPAPKAAPAPVAKPTTTTTTMTTTTARQWAGPPCHPDYASPCIKVGLVPAPTCAEIGQPVFLRSDGFDPYNLTNGAGTGCQ